MAAGSRTTSTSGRSSWAPPSPRDSASATNRLRNYRDLNGDAGGYLRKDRLWWCASARDHASSARQVTFPVQPLEAHVTTFTGKGTWRVNDTHQIVVFAQGSRNRQPIRLDGFLRPTTAKNITVESTLGQLAGDSSGDGVERGHRQEAVRRGAGRPVRRQPCRAPNGALAPNGGSPAAEVFGGNRDRQEEWHTIR